MTDSILPPLRPGALDADVPLELIPPDDRRAVAAIREDPTLVRPLVVKRVEAPLATFEGLLDDLPRASRLVESLGMGRYRIEPRPDGTIAIDDGYGARAVVARLFSAPGARVYRATGLIEVFPVPPLRGTGIITLRVEQEPGRAPFDAPQAERIAAEATPGAPVDPPRGVLTGGQIFFRLESNVLHRIARPFLRLLHAAIDAKVRTLVAAAIAACEHEVSADQIRSGGKRSG
jgi:hypothetical protein